MADVTDQQIAEAQQVLVAAGVTPARYLRVFAAANPAKQGDDESQITVRMFAYGETTTTYDRAEWRQAIVDERLDHLIDHDASDLDTDTLIVDDDGAIIEPY